MAFARGQTISEDNGRDVLHYAVDIEYMLNRIQYVKPNLTKTELIDIMGNMDVDSLIMRDIISKINYVESR